MSLSSFASTVTLAFLFAVLCIFVVLRSHKKAHQKRGLRKHLAEKMSATPLPKMLQALGVGGATFLYRESVDVIDTCIKNCETCTTLDQCREKLKLPELNPEDIEFCNNKEYLTKYSRSSRINA